MEYKEMFLGAIEITNDNVKHLLCTSKENGKFYIRDSLNIEKNQITKRVGKNILTGDENWRFDSKTKTFAYYQENKFNIDGLGKYDTMMCNYFRWQPYSTDVKTSMFQGNECGEIMFRFEEGKDVEVFKNWLREKYQIGAPVVVFFSLQYPIIKQNGRIYNLDVFSMGHVDFKNVDIISGGSVQPIVTINSRDLRLKL